ncbi:hypothetical protein BD408DRAFT_477941 [Parasitella parasitica]|nr:hypothetical protein BD408DRAFT_477941 [Parasitella parasitica]
MIFRFTSLIVAISLTATLTDAAGMIAQVVDATNFCVFLPPTDSTDRIISNTEWNANSFCMGSTPGATGAEKMPSGFITSAHYVKTDLYVQVTGQMDYTKANLVGTDEGGQMDIKAPTGSSCAGWSYYVNLIEPVSNTYCMRCCNDAVSCNRGISEKGCAHIIPGDYSGPNSSSPAAATTPTAAVSATPTSSTVAPSTITLSSSTTAAVSPFSTGASSSAAGSSSPATKPVLTTAASPSNASDPVTDGPVSEQALNAAGINKPLSLAVSAGILVSAAMIAL